MKFNDVIVIISQALAGIASIHAIVYLSELITSIAYGSSPAVNAISKLLFLLIPVILIWNFTPKIVNKLYKGEREINKNTLKSIVILSVGVSFGFSIIVELMNLSIVLFIYPNYTANYIPIIITIAGSIALLITSSLYLINKSKNV